MGIGFWLFVLSGSITLSVSTAFTTVVFKAKKAKGIVNVESNYNNQFAENNYDNFQSGVFDESMTVPLSDIPVQPKPEPQMSKQQAPKNGTITGINGSCAGFQVHINTGEQVIIGKDANMANIVIDASYGSVSRKHVGISYDVARGKYCVTDYSSNGTYVDGNRLTKNKAVFISPGSEIQIADDKNTFLLG